jgi:ankyrin repeat protein
MKTLIEHGADQFLLTDMKRNCLHQAAESKRPEIMEFVLNLPEFDGHKLDLNHQDGWGETPLHVAVGGSFDCVKMLLEEGAKRDVRENAGQVPLHLASLSRGLERQKIVDIISSDRGLHINARDLNGLPPIFNFLDTPECVAMLLDRGASISLCDDEGRNAIHHACMEDEADSLKLLLGAASDSDLPVSLDKNGDVPLAKAFEFKSGSCIKVLLELDAIGDMNEKDGMTLAHRAAQMGDADVLRCVFNHPTFKKGQKDSKGRTVEEVATLDTTYKEEVRDLIQQYESKGRRVDRKGKGRSTAAGSAGPSSAALEARMAYFSYK